jgi:lipopolysaccharide transport system ATP-binding protein
MLPAIHARGLGKQYRIGARRASYGSLRESLTEALRAPFRAWGRLPQTTDSTIWALKDVDLEIQPGEVVGIIGRNGAGKSTLLKILSRITEPSTGEVDLFGRVGSLLEVGTGFHPELTGRENIYLNGAVLGMKRREIQQKFDAMVAFAEVDKFLDTPVKHYSSGMYMRLAFAVAAHLEPEILLVDEVLAVGDAVFQKKCLGKMGEVARQGRTVLFVSHNIAAVRTLCSSALLLRDGQVDSQGSVKTCVERYLELSQTNQAKEVDTSQLRRSPVADTALRINSLRLCTRRTGPSLAVGEAIELELRFQVTEGLEDVVLGVALVSTDQVHIFECRSSHCYGIIPSLQPGAYSIRCRIEETPLIPGHYFLSAGARCAKKHLDHIPEAMMIEVVSEEGASCPWFDEVGGCLMVSSEWTQPERTER